jgi:hypothetical protein
VLDRTYVCPGRPDRPHVLAVEDRSFSAAAFRDRPARPASVASSQPDASLGRVGAGYRRAPVVFGGAILPSEAKGAAWDQLDAYDYYLRGMASFHRGDREGMNEALPLFNEAIERDPNSRRLTQWPLLPFSGANSTDGLLTALR